MKFVSDLQQVSGHLHIKFVWFTTDRNFIWR
jgi:hypothetical protein